MWSVVQTYANVHSKIFKQWRNWRITKKHFWTFFFLSWLLLLHTCLSVHVNDWPFRIKDCEGAIDCASLCKLHVWNTALIVNIFSIGVNDWPTREIENIFVVFDCPKVQLFFCWCYWMLIHNDDMQIVLLKVRSR